MKLTDNEKRLLKTVVDTFDREDRSVRERQIRQWRRLKLFWEGFTKVWYSEVAHDWRIWDEQVDNNTDQSYYDKPINIFRAYLESIIAALSVLIPPIKCFPDDADNSLDLSTAKAGDKIAQLIFRHNDVSLIWLHALFTYCTEGMVACYSYPKEDKKFGTYEEKKYEEVEELNYKCPSCGADQNAELFTNREKDEFQPDNNDTNVNNEILNENKIICLECAAEIDENHEPEHQFVSRLVGVTTKPKSRIIMEVYGGLYVKVPNYAKKQEDIPYLGFSYETNYVNALERYPDLKPKIGPSSGGAYEPYERWGRLSPQYQGEYPINTVTVRNYWLRPTAFNTLNDENEAASLKKRFPDGARVVLINEEFADAVNESLDDHWTLTYNPLADFLHYDPLGMLLTSVQDITNDLISLTLQTIEHGIGQTFADPGVLNFNAYEQTEVVPGGIFPAQAKSGKNLQEGFHELKTATLSHEVLPFAQNIQQLGQLVSGALPSLFGGSIEGSETASQYAMSRAQALQRLQTTWKLFTVWWKTIFGKAIPMFIKEMKDDEKFVTRDEHGNFLNVFIRRAELEGKIGSVELEANENLPITWHQQKDVVFQLMQAANPQVLAILASPDNLPVLHQALGLVDFTVPGEDDRQKQYEEIQQLINSEPIIQPPDPMEMELALTQRLPPPQEQELPSVEVEPEIDNHQIGFDICRKWLVSDAGRQAKNDNPAGYRNVLLHAKMHLQFIMPAPVEEGSGARPSEKPNIQTEAPILNEGNVNDSIQ